MSAAVEAAGDLTIEVQISAAQVMVGVRGEIDLLTAPDLRAALDALVDRGHSRLVLDLGLVTFIGISGLEVIAATAVRLWPADGGLILRGPSKMTRRILDITRISDLVTFEDSDGPTPLGAEQQAGDTSRLVASSSTDAYADLARLAAVPANVVVVDAALRLVVALARATVAGADGVSVSLNRYGRVDTVAASDETIAQMDRDQYSTGEGPCLAAAAQGHWFHVESLDTEPRWPQFSPKARAGGIASILSTPLLVDAKPVGALNIYSRTDRAFGPESQELAALFATQASGILADAGSDFLSGVAGRRLLEALRSREIIAQAQGIMMQRGAISADEAYGLLRRSARQSDRPIRQVALDLLGSTFRGGDLDDG